MNMDNLKTDDLPLIAIIIVTWNKEEYVVRLLHQLKRIAYPAEKIVTVLVDNNSSDNTVEVVASSFPEIRLIKNKENLGGAGGFNTGMRWVFENDQKIEFIWLLDNDVEVENDTLRHLVSLMQSHNDTAVCGSKIIDIGNKETVIEAGSYIDYKLGGIIRNKPDNENYFYNHDVFEVDYVAACSLLVRTPLVRKLGMMKEKLFIYWDDMEWCARFKKAGYRVMASNTSIVYHPSWNERTLDNSSIWRYYYRTRNSLWFFNNYSTGARRRILINILIIRIMFASFISCLNSNKALSKAFIEGIEDFFQGQYGRKQFDHVDNTGNINFKAIYMINIILKTWSFLFAGCKRLPDKEFSESGN